MVKQTNIQELLDMLERIKRDSFRPDMKKYGEETEHMLDAFSKSIKLILEELIDLRLQTKILAVRENAEPECENGCYPIDEYKNAWITNVRCLDAEKHIMKD